jgi:hypothetical protein
MGHMSLYALQKLIWDVNRKPACREGETVVYEAVKPWATGIGMMTFAHAAAA